jgi:hypothetical protein
MDDRSRRSAEVMDGSSQAGSRAPWDVRHGSMELLRWLGMLLLRAGRMLCCAGWYCCC